MISSEQKKLINIDFIKDTHQYTLLVDVTELLAHM